jgi:hypothetical protein
MGMSPAEVDRTSFWKFMAAWNGYVSANTPSDGKLTESEAEALFDWIGAESIATHVPPMPEFIWDGNRLTSRQ